MDKKVEIQNMEFKSLIGAMESESINTVIAGMTKTAEREESVDFSDSYYTSNQALILKKDSKMRSRAQMILPERRSVFRKEQLVISFLLEKNLVKRTKSS